MFEKLIIQKTLRVPTIGASRGGGGGSIAARQMDSVLLTAGFTASRALLEHVAGLEPGAAMDRALLVISAAREMVGDNIAHNPYYIDFPSNVPSTLEFWFACLRAAVGSAPAGGEGEDRGRAMSLALSSLPQMPTYGHVGHTFEEMLARHDPLVASAKDRLTVLHLGRTVEEETTRLYMELAESVVPLGPADLELLGRLAVHCIDGPQPEVIPMRESRAVINADRLVLGADLVGIDTVNDVLRLVCQVSDGDVSLRTPTRFRRFTGPERRVLMTALNTVIKENPGKLGDVPRHSEAWARLAQTLHPYDFEKSPHAHEVFAVARGDKAARSLAGRFAVGFASPTVEEKLQAVRLLATSPGMLMRSLDLILRTLPAENHEAVLSIVGANLDRVSGRVLCSMREHIVNRTSAQVARVFFTQSRRAWVTEDTRPPLDEQTVAALGTLIDEELLRRTPETERLVFDPEVLTLAVPLSGKGTDAGFGVMPRGSVVPVEGELLRLFTYWRQTAGRTDFDLSVLMLDKDFEPAGHVGFTNLRYQGISHSHDIVDAPDGATEFIDIALTPTPAADLTDEQKAAGYFDALPDSVKYLVPKVLVYYGETFTEVAESMFGFMVRDRDQRGAPFEAATVRMRSDMRGTGRAAFPVVFIRGDDNTWSAKWTNIYQQGRDFANMIEQTKITTALLARAVIEREFLPVSSMVALLVGKAGSVQSYRPDMNFDGPVTFIGIHAPDGLPEGSTVITLDRLNELVPR